MSALTLACNAADLTIVASRELSHVVNPFTDSQITDNKTRTAFNVIGYAVYYIGRMLFSLSFTKMKLWERVHIPFVPSVGSFQCTDRQLALVLIFRNCCCIVMHF